MRINLDILILDHSSLNTTSYIAFFFTSRLSIDKRYGQFFFHKNIYVDRKTEKLNITATKRDIKFMYMHFFMYIRYKKFIQILKKDKSRLTKR